MTRHIFICCGLSGSGKSTYLTGTPSSMDVVLCRDAFAKIHGYTGEGWRKYVSDEIRRWPTRTFFIDQVTDTIKSFKRLLEGVEWLDNDEITLLAFHTDIEECRARVMLRQHGRIKDGLKYLFEESCRNNPLISKDEFDIFKASMSTWTHINPNRLHWRAITQ